MPLVAEGKIMRRANGLINDKGIWRERYNQEQYIIFKDVEISNYMRLASLRWVGRLI